jgi:hypothetical protein
MANFTEEQLVELETTFCLKRCETLLVRDGVIRKGETVWWQGEDEPEQVRSDPCASASFDSITDGVAYIRNRKDELAGEYEGYIY